MRRKQKTKSRAKPKPASLAEKPLTPKQQRFVDEFFIHNFNSTQAYLNAGYKVTNPEIAKVNASRLLTFANVALAIQKRKEKLSIKKELSHEWVVSRLIKNYRRAMQVEPVLDREGNETGQYVYQGQVANKALELIGKHIGMFETKVHVTGQVEHMHAHLTGDQILDRLQQLVAKAEERAALPQAEGETGTITVDAAVGTPGLPQET